MNELRRRYLDQPHEVSLETLSLCNAACTFCPYPTLDRIGTKLSDEVLERLVAEMSEFDEPFYFSPFKVNEPLLDKRTIPLCQSVNRQIPHAHIRMFTNGSTLTASNVESISRLKNIVHLWISLNSVDSDEYHELMCLNFDQTAKKIDALHKRGFPYEVVLSKVGPDKDFVRYCADRWPKFKPVCIKKDSWLGFTKPDSPEIPNTPCSRWFELSIMADGKISHCCMDSGDSRYSIGDVHESTLLEIYNSPFWRERREKMVSRKELDYRSPCSRCSY